MKRGIFLGAAMLAAMAAAGGDAHAAVPDPAKTIVTGAFFLPYPVSSPASYYAYQRIADAGLDVIITIAKPPADPPPDNTHDFNSQSSMISKAADTNPPLWVIVERGGKDRSSHGIFADTTASYGEVEALMNQSAFLNATNIYGWGTWHEPDGSDIGKSAQLELYVREAADALGQDSTRTTFVGFFGISELADINLMLDELDDNAPNYPTGYGRRPVFGVEAYRFRPQTIEGSDTCGSFATSALNHWLGGLRDVVLEHPYQYPWWSVVTITDYICCCHPDNGPPSMESLRMDVFTHLAWGAKGVFYYTYMHNDQSNSSWGDPNSPAHWQGVFNAAPPNYTSVDPSDPFNDVYDWITAINGEIHALGGILGPAQIKRPVVGTPYHYDSGYASWAADHAGPSSFVTSLVISPTDQGRVNALATPLTISNRDTQHSNYVLAVNQWETDVYSNEAVGPTAISLTINPDSLGGTGGYLVAEDTLNGRWLIANDFILTDSLAAGEAKMYRLWKWNGGSLNVPANTTVKYLTPIGSERGGRE